jgi:glycosyltransferase involved in cell wall biosynthesis
VKHAALLLPGLDRIAGVERQVMLLAQGLRKRDWRVSVVTLSGCGGNAAKELNDAGIEFHTLGMRKGLADPRGWIRFHSWLRRNKPDVVHAHLPHAAWLARGSRLFARIPVVIDTLHSSWTGGVARRTGYRLSRWLPDGVTAVSHSASASHLHAKMIIADTLRVIPNGVDTSNFRPAPLGRDALRRQLGVSEEFLWIAAGRLEPVKDYATLLRAMTGLPRQARLVIAGAGAQEAELRRLCASLGLEERVRFAGFVAEIAVWMQAADGFVLSSLWEGLPVSLLEAAACALPAVATDVSGTREVILPGRTGYLVDPQMPAQLARSMLAIMQASDGERRAMGVLARALIVEKFDKERVLDQWEALYTELMERVRDHSSEPCVDCADI